MQNLASIKWILEAVETIYAIFDHDAVYNPDSSFPGVETMAILGGNINRKDLTSW